MNGNFQGPNSLAVPNGSIEFTLNVDATVVATPYGIVLANVPVVFQFDENGDIQSGAQIWSNQELNPQNTVGLGTYYLVAFYDQNGARVNTVPMWWQFTQVKNSTVDIGKMVPFATVGGNIIFYPTSFGITAPGPAALGGIFSHAGSASQWVSSVNTDGTVTLSQPAFTDISGQITNAQLPAVITFTSVTASGLVIAQANLQLGVVGSTSGQITFEGSTSGASYITGPATAGVITNPFVFTNSINIPTGTVFAINGDTGLSRASAGVFDVGNGTAGNASGKVNAAQYQIAGAQIAASNLSNGTTGTTSIVLSASPTLTGTITAAIITASGLITAQANINLGKVGGTSGTISLVGTTSGTATITGPAVAGTVTNPILISNSVTLAATCVLSTPTLFLSGKISTYSGITTVRGGVPIMLASSLLTAQAAAITPTTVYAIPAAQGGMYRITYVATVTTGDSTGFTLGGSTGFRIVFTNANGDAIVKTSNPTTANVSAVNATGTTISGTVTGYAADSTNLQYAFDVTLGTGDGRYDLAIYVEFLG